MTVSRKITTQRLILRPLQSTDAEDFNAIENDAEVKRFLGGPTGGTVDGCRNIISKLRSDDIHAPLAVTCRQKGSFLGYCGFLPYEENRSVIGEEVYVVLGRQCARRQGYATEVGKALITHALGDLNCNEIYGVFEVADRQGSPNESSEGLCKKLGFQYIANTSKQFKGRLNPVPVKVFKWQTKP